MQWAVFSAIPASLGDNGSMKSSLQNSNPWLLEPGRRAELLRLSAASSSAIEGIVKPFLDKPAPALERAPRSPRVKSGPALG